MKGKNLKAMSRYQIIDKIDAKLGRHLKKHAAKGTLKDQDKALIMSLDTLNNFNNEEKTQVKATFDSGNAIVIIKPGKDLSVLHKILETGMTGNLQDRVLAYAIDQEPDGSIWAATYYDLPTTQMVIRTTLKPNVGAEPTITEDEPKEFLTLPMDIGFNVSDDLRQWLYLSNSRQKSNIAQRARNGWKDEPKNQLTDLAKQYVDSAYFYWQGQGATKPNSYGFHYFVFSCYTKDTERNWFLLQQFGELSSSDCFIYSSDTFCGWFAHIYSMGAWPSKFPNNPDIVSVIQGSPETTTGVTTIESSVSYNLSGTVSYSKSDGGAGSVTGGMEISNSRSVEIPDVTIEYYTDQVKSQWDFSMPMCTPDDDGCVNSFHLPPLITYKTFQPYNQWIWMVTDEAREYGSLDIDTLFHLELRFGVVGDCNIFGCHCDINNDAFPQDYPHSFSLPFPPNGN